VSTVALSSLSCEFSKFSHLDSSSCCQQVASALSDMICGKYCLDSDFVERSYLDSIWFVEAEKVALSPSL